MRRGPAAALCGLVLTAGLAADPAPFVHVKPAEVAKYLQIPSPDWRDQMLYFVMTDRFFDGDPANSDQKAGEYDPTLESKYNGGDLKGLTQKLDYIKGLGMTGVWITPPVANQWWDPEVRYGGYHGYWGENFVEVDKHLGTLQDYRLLSASLHRNGMVLVQDIVPNHTGNFFHFDPPEVAGGEPRGFRLNTGSVPVTRPTQKPFDRNDWSNPADRKAAIYHWTPPISDYNNRAQTPTYQLADLDDLNTENPVVVNALKDSYASWIRRVGVDGFRIDTLRYVPMAFWTEFHNSANPQHPGLRAVAKGLGKTNFFTFGEDWETNIPYQDRADRTMATYLGEPDAPGVGGLLNFPLQADLADVFGKGRPTDQLSYRLKAQNLAYADPTVLVNFIDNHDMDRLAANAGPDAVRLALFFLYTVPGIPVLYYGTEQGLKPTRAAMFAGGWGSGGQDHFDLASDGYRYLRSLTALRSSERELSHGKLRVVKDANSAGLLAYTVTWQKRTALVVLNTSDHRALLDTAATGLPPNTVLRRSGGVNEGAETGATWTVGEGGLVNGILGPRSAVLLAAPVALAETLAPATPVAAITGANNPVFTVNTAVAGVLPPGLTEPRLVVAGNLDAAVALKPDAAGAWTAVVPVETLDNGPASAVVLATAADGSRFVSAPYKFRVALAFTTRVRADDPVGDDKGRSGSYQYPTDATFNHQNDIKAIDVATVGKNLKVTLTMAAPLTTVWKPINGFDHTLYLVALQVPGLDGAATVLPFQNAQVPPGIAWNRLAFVEGWRNQLYGPDGAGPEAWGTPVSPGAQIAVDAAQQTVSFTFSPQALGFPSTLSGTKVYVNTWDYNGLINKLRPLAPEGGDFTYAGPADGPLIMDETAVLTVP